MMANAMLKNNIDPSYILSASQKNNVAEVLRLVTDEGVDPNHGNMVGQTALHIASLWGNVETVGALINAGANVNVQNQIGQMTPLHCAIRGTFQSFYDSHERRVEVVKLLLAAGADVTIADSKGKDAYETIDDVCKEAEARKMSINPNDRSIKNDELIMQQEMRHTLDRARLNSSPLIQFIDNLDVEGLEERLREAQEADTVEDDEGGDKKISKVLLGKTLRCAIDKYTWFVDENDSNNDHAYAKLRDIVSCLLKYGTNPNTFPNPYQKLEDAPLHIISVVACSTALLSNNIASVIAMEIGQELITHGAQIGTATKDLLPHAANKGSLAAVEYLINSLDSDPNVRGRQGMTALILAARAGKTDIVKYLLHCDKAVELEITDDAGNRAIDYATKNNREDIVALLNGGVKS